MPVLFERTRPTKQQLRAVFAHIRRRREKEKAEEEAKRAKEEEEKRKKEEEARKRKEELEDVAKQIEALEEKLKSLKKEKRELFAQLKKDLLQKQEDENRKKSQFLLYNPTGTHITGPKGFSAPNPGAPGSAVLFPGTCAVSGPEEYQAGPGNAKHPISPASHNIAPLGASGLPNNVGQTQQQQTGRYQGYSAQYVTHQQGQSSALHMQNEGHYGAMHHPVAGAADAADVSTSQPHQTGSYYPEPRTPGHGNAGQEPFGRPQVHPGGQQGQIQGGSQVVGRDCDQTLHREGSQTAGGYANQGQNQGPSQSAEQSRPPYGRCLSKTSGQQQGYGAQPMQGQQHGSAHSQPYYGAQQGSSQQGQQPQREYHGQQYSHGGHMSQESKPHQVLGQEHTAYHAPAQSDKQLAQPQFQSSVHMQQTYPSLHSQSQNFPSEQQQQVPQTQNYQSQHGYQVQQDQLAHQQKYQQIQQPYPHSSQQRSQQQGTSCQGRQNQYDQKLHQQTASGPTTPLSGKKQESTHGGQTQGQPSTYNNQYLTQQEYGDQHHSQGAHSSKRPSHRYHPYLGYQGSKGRYQGTSKKFSGKYSQGSSQEETAQGSSYAGGSSHSQQRHHHQHRGHKSDGAGSYNTPSAQQRTSRYYS